MLSVRDYILDRKTVYRNPNGDYFYRTKIAVALGADMGPDIPNPFMVGTTLHRGRGWYCAFFENGGSIYEKPASLGICSVKSDHEARIRVLEGALGRIRDGIEDDRCFLMDEMMILSATPEFLELIGADLADREKGEEIPNYAKWLRPFLKVESVFVTRDAAKELACGEPSQELSDLIFGRRRG